MPAERGAVAGILLAAGTASRMGKDKLLLPIGGESLLRRAARRATEAGLHPLIVVLGHEVERMRGELEGLRCRIAVNPDYAEGIHLSVRAGMAALTEGDAPDAVVVMLGDMPFVTRDMLARLVDHYRGGSAPLVISDYDGVKAPPMLYDRSLFPELRALQGPGCGREVVKRHGAEAAVVSWPAAALADVDLPEDYERVRGEIEADTPRP